MYPETIIDTYVVIEKVKFTERGLNDEEKLHLREKTRWGHSIEVLHEMSSIVCPAPRCWLMRPMDMMCRWMWVVSWT